MEIDDLIGDIQQAQIAEDLTNESKGILVAMTGLSKQTYPNIDQDVLESLKNISESWSDPIDYTRKSKISAELMIAVKTWYALNDPTLNE